MDIQSLHFERFWTAVEVSQGTSGTARHTSAKVGLEPVKMQ
jgi:hypothetical protein